MIWSSFFAGAVAMLFTLLLGMFLLPAQRDKARQGEVDRMDELAKHWRLSNQFASERNDALNDINLVLIQIAKRMKIDALD